ncbi:hypothetical protein JZ751_017093 [Albula glossodonta]|uniref:Uncharacterized protein n=1 Tax=Albula glossodonta TaxID=121402 RepID=A0A8T2NR94_9TELE|nr:hypothetical protein JZ751_017093 [Albula glossodonta]
MRERTFSTLTLKSKRWIPGLKTEASQSRAPPTLGVRKTAVLTDSDRGTEVFFLARRDDCSGTIQIVPVKTSLWKRRGDCKQNGVEDLLSACDNCIALEAGTVAGILVGEIVATALIGVAVYLIASQPQGKAYRQGNKASDRQNLIQNQHNDTTYQPLSGHSSDYSQLEPRRHCEDPQLLHSQCQASSWHALLATPSAQRPDRHGQFSLCTAFTAAYLP